MQLKKKLALLAALCLSLGLLAGCGNSGKTNDNETGSAPIGDEPSDSEQMDNAELLSGKHHVEIEVHALSIKHK